MTPRLKLFVFGLFFCSAAHAQDTTNGFFKYASLGVQFYAGSAIGITYNRIKDSRPYTAEIYYQRQINPGPNWNHTKRLPQFGMGVSLTNSGSKAVGSIVCVYPYIKLPLYTVGALGGNLRFGFGLSWVEKPYDKITNPEDLLLSQKINTHANIQWQNEVRLNSRHFLNAAITFYHCSNAKTNLPNLGINIPSLSLGYRYAFNGEARKPVESTDTLNKKIFYKIFLSGGVKQMQVPDSSYYFVKILSGEISKQISYSSILSIGAFITHDASVKTDTLIKHLGSVETSQVALYGSYEYNFGRVTIPVQFGVFVYNGNSNLVESVGLRYKITRKLMAEFLLKAHGHKADLIHFGVGYVFR